LLKAVFQYRPVCGPDGQEVHMRLNDIA